MRLSELGRCAERCWLDIPNHFPFVVLHEFVVMPNHVHGILAIDKPVETQNLASLQGRQNRFGSQSQNLASIIRGYKIGVSKYAKNQGINFAWQARFHDHVIRSEENYLKIAEYIQTNPQRWLEDTYYV